jgi:REP element-mobilizing transposase RayT
MSVRRAIAEKDGIYFITFTCKNWLLLFKLTNSYDAVYKWFDHLKTKGHYITGYVILPNHLHVLIGFKALLSLPVFPQRWPLLPCCHQQL